MSNTYKSFEGLSGDRTFSVVKTGNGVLATIKPEGRPLGATIAVADCPAIALAFLVASGVTPTRTDTYTVGEPDHCAG